MKTERFREVDLFGDPIEERQTKTDVIPFEFEGHKIRMRMVDGKPWLVAADVCAAMELGNPTEAVRSLADDEKMTLSNPEGQGGRGAQSFNVVNEPGFYRLVFKSRKEVAERLRRFVFHEVLPQIRKTGSYKAVDRVGKVARKIKADRKTAETRVKQVDINKQISGRLWDDGATVRDLVRVHNETYRGQFNGRDTGDLQKLLGVKKHVSPLDRMDDVVLSANLHAKKVAERFIVERAKSGQAIPINEQPAVFRASAHEVTANTLEQLGRDYTLGLTDHPKRGLILDVVHKQLPRP